MKKLKQDKQTFSPFSYSIDLFCSYHILIVIHKSALIWLVPPQTIYHPFQVSIQYLKI